jgi:hypothetical protein
MAILTTVVTGVLAATITNLFQKRQFKFREKEARQSELRKQREEFVNEFMTRVSGRLYNLLSIIQIITGDVADKEEIKTRINSYNQSVKDTLINYSRDLAYLKAFFGDEINKMYARQIMEGPAGFVELGKAWRLIFNKYDKAINETLPQIKMLSEQGEITEEKAKELTASVDEYIEKIIEKGIEVRDKARALGYSPIGTPFYVALTSKEDLFIEED